MTDLEILAKFKTSYEALLDVLENSIKEQIEDKDYEKINAILDTLGEQYDIMYEKIVLNDERSLYYHGDIRIANCIYGDYMDSEGNLIAAGDLNRLEWWKNIKYLWSFDEDKREG